MYKLTVLYNLPPGSDHSEFVQWRVGPHQQGTLQMPGLIRSDFYAIEDRREGTAPYRYMTELYFSDRQTFERAFYDAAYQERLNKALARVTDPLFLFSREIITATPEGG